MGEFPADSLLGLVHGTLLEDTELRSLQAWEYQNPQRLAALKIDPTQLEAVIRERSHWFITVASDFREFCAQVLGTPVPLWETLWTVWLPLAIHLANQRQRWDHLFIQGVLGGQGTGKTTLTRLLKHLLHHLGYRATSLSLDDLYKTFLERQQLQKQDPRLLWRGPPGTHDIDLGLTTITQLKSARPNQTVAIPRFDKALHHGTGDRTEPDWVCNIDILFFEGWFVGAQPIDPKDLVTAPDPIQTPTDRQFALDMNQALHAYLPLWETLDALWVLYPEDYRLSKTWRKQAEAHLRSQGQGGMSDTEIDDFVTFFWKALHPDLFIRPLVEGRHGADLAISIQHNHLPSHMFNPRLLSR